MHLFFDTETTGMIAKGYPAGHPAQPHICQLGAQLCNQSCRVVAEINLLVKPDRWSIPAEAEAIHGISTAMCEQYGLPIKTVATLFIRLAQRAKLSIAHNRPFDNTLIWTELIRCELPTELAYWLEMPGFCTMEAASPIVNLPPTPRMIAAGYNKPKPPTMLEAYSFFHDGAKFDGAHDAMADVNACRSVYYKIVDRAVPVAVVPEVTPATEPEEV